jgi:hypothetical protein
MGTFHPMVGGIVVGVIMNVADVCVEHIIDDTIDIIHSVVVVLLASKGGSHHKCLFTHLQDDGSVKKMSS